jgi:hypothetical protein
VRFLAKDLAAALGISVSRSAIPESGFSSPNVAKFKGLVAPQNGAPSVSTRASFSGCWSWYSCISRPPYECPYMTTRVMPCASLSGWWIAFSTSASSRASDSTGALRQSHEKRQPREPGAMPVMNLACPA